MKAKRLIIGALIALGLLGGGVALAQISNTIVLNGSIAGSAPSITARGNDSNISINLIPKGSGTVQINGSPIAAAGGTVAGNFNILGFLNIQPGTNGTLKGVGASISNTSTTTTTTLVATEQDLYNFSVPANTLSALNQYLTLRFIIQNAATANAKQTRAYFGATTICDSTSIAVNNAFYDVTITIWRTGAATQLAECSSRLTAVGGAWNAAGGASAINQTTPAETLSGAVTLRVTGTDAVAAGGTSLKAANLSWYPAGQ